MCNIVFVIISILFYIGTVVSLRRKANRKMVEVRLVVYCVFNVIGYFIPIVVLTIVELNTKWQLLAAMLGLVLSCQISAVLLPTFSKELRDILFSWKKKPTVVNFDEYPLVVSVGEYRYPLVNTVTNVNVNETDE
jgi:hypothetical protein